MMTYVGTSMLVAYLAIAFIRECIVKLFRSHFPNRNSKEVAEIQEQDNNNNNNNTNNNNNNNNNNISEVENGDVHCVVNIECEEQEKGSVSNNGRCECEAENGTQETPFSTKQMAVLALAIGPIWFVSEVSNSSLFQL